MQDPQWRSNALSDSDSSNKVMSAGSLGVRFFASFPGCPDSISSEGRFFSSSFLPSVCVEATCCFLQEPMEKVGAKVPWPSCQCSRLQHFLTWSTHGGPTSSLTNDGKGTKNFNGILLSHKK